MAATPVVGRLVRRRPSRDAATPRRAAVGPAADDDGLPAAASARRTCTRTAGSPWRCGPSCGGAGWDGRSSCWPDRPRRTATRWPPRPSSCSAARTCAPTSSRWRRSPRPRSGGSTATPPSCCTRRRSRASASCRSRRPTTVSPTLATRRGSLDEVLPPGHPGARRVRRRRGRRRGVDLLHDAEEATRARRGPAHARATVHWDRTAELLMELFQDVLAAPRSGSLVIEGKGEHPTGIAVTEPTWPTRPRPACRARCRRGHR